MKRKTSTVFATLKTEQMKTNTMSPTKIVYALGILALMVFGYSCKNSKVKSASTERKIEVLCSGDKYFSNNKFFRANAIGESMDQMTAKKKSMSNARAELASKVNTTVTAVIDNYVNSREFNNVEEVEERFESLTREVINQELSGTKVICEENTVTNEGKYKSYLAIELSGQDMLTKMHERLSTDDRLKIDYDYEKFKEEYEKEMQRLRDGG